MVSTFILLTASCSGNEHKNAAETDLKLWAKDQKIIDIKSIKWGSSEEIGTPTSPKIKYRLDVDFQIIDQTYTGKYYVKWLNVKVIEPNLSKGHILTKTLYAVIYKKDGKIIVNWQDRPRFLSDSALFDEFLKNEKDYTITLDDIAIKGQNESKAFSKLSNYWEKNYPIYEKLESEIPPEVKNGMRYHRLWSNDERIQEYFDLRQKLGQLQPILEFLR